MREKIAQFRYEFYSTRSLRPWIYLSAVLHAIFLYALETWEPEPRIVDRSRNVLQVAFSMTQPVEAKVVPAKPDPPKAPKPPEPKKPPPRTPSKPVIKKDPPKRVDPPKDEKKVAPPTQVARVPTPEPTPPQPASPPRPPAQVQPPKDSDLPAWYLEQIYWKVVQNWDQPAYNASLRPNANATVYFEITRKGNIDFNSIRLFQESGYRPLDDSALAAIKATAFFGEIPKTFPRDRLKMRIIFSLEAAA